MPVPGNHGCELDDLDPVDKAHSRSNRTYEWYSALRRRGTSTHELRDRGMEMAATICGHFSFVQAEAYEENFLNGKLLTPTTCGSSDISGSLCRSTVGTCGAVG
jgi:hypothetical protein